MKTDLASSLRSLADRIDEGKFSDLDSCIFVLTSNESLYFDAHFLGKPLTYSNAILTVEGLVGELKDEAGNYDDENTTLN